jgi:squalene synthase HpnD
MSAADSTTGELPPEIRVVQERAAGSSFYSAMRLMPKIEREAMFAIYAFCRAVDDIADDGVGTRLERHEALDRWRADLDALYNGDRPRLTAFLAGAVKRCGLRKEDFFAVIDGMDMDVAEDIRAPDLATLDLYCERVASAVGRLSIKVFGMEEEPGFALAHHLGRALQLTNILRDIDEDAGIGRLYLPREYLENAGIETRDPEIAISDPAIDGACRKVAALAHAHYRDAGLVMLARPRGRIRTPKLMGAVYAEILREMEKAGWAPPRRRVSLGKGKLLRIVLANGLLG